MNCGPGSIGGCFIHDSHSKKTAIVTSTTVDENFHFQQVTVDPPRFSGWWGHRLEDRFVMAPQFIPCEGAYGYRLSNPPVLLIAGARASLDLFDKVHKYAHFKFFNGRKCVEEMLLALSKTLICIEKSARLHFEALIAGRINLIISRRETDEMSSSLPPPDLIISNLPALNCSLTFPSSLTPI